MAHLKNPATNDRNMQRVHRDIGAKQILKFTGINCIKSPIYRNHFFSFVFCHRRRHNCHPCSHYFAKRTLLMTPFTNYLQTAPSRFYSETPQFAIYSRLSPKLSNRNDPTARARHADVSLVYCSSDGLSRHTGPRRRAEICPAYRP